MVYCGHNGKRGAVLRLVEVTEGNDMMDILHQRFEKHPWRHEGLRWEDVAARLAASPEAVAALQWMEETGGEPDVIGVEDGRILFADCAAESPAGRRSLCYDEAARLGRKKNAPDSSALEQASAHGIALITETQYRAMQEKDAYDLKTSSWIATPEAIRRLGGALFCERRYDAVFTFHNGADSYYGVRGWRGVVAL